MVNWETLPHKKTVNEQVSIFNETIMNIFSKFFPIKLIIFNDSDILWGCYGTTENPAFYLALYLIGVHVWGELQHVGHVDGQKTKF